MAFNCSYVSSVLSTCLEEIKEVSGVVCYVVREISIDVFVSGLLYVFSKCFLACCLIACVCRVSVFFDVYVGLWRPRGVYANSKVFFCSFRRGVGRWKVVSVNRQSMSFLERSKMDPHLRSVFLKIKLQMLC